MRFAEIAADDVAARRPPFAATILLAAFLLFLLEPLIAKAILPWFGGSAAVWTTCMLFFQSTLLAGYAYADLLARRTSARTQTLLHGTALLSSLLFLPVSPSPRWKPTGGEDPVLGIMTLLLGTIGLPFFLLASTSPLLQAWAAGSPGTASPYRLYSLSNLGSFAALLAYPILFEPLLGTSGQAGVWSAVYVLFVAVSLASAAAARGGPALVAVTRMFGSPTEAPSAGVAILWIALAACGSTLLLAITNRISHDLSVTPLLWVLPLALYLATFILCFESDRWYPRRVFLWMLPAGIGGIVHTVSLQLSADVWTALPLYGLGLFITCMICHGELARLRPSEERLTAFYFCVALGGALGGIFVGLVAPRAFDDYFELPIALLATLILAPCAALADPGHGIASTRRGRLAAAVVVGTLAALFVAAEEESAKAYRLRARDFYGVLRVQDVGTPPRYRVLWHGITNHGIQRLEPGRRREPTSYYGPTSGIRGAIEDAGGHGPIRVGVLGLGAGVLASLGRAGDFYRFYEIDPLVVAIARSEFTFLDDSPARNEVAIGDARLLLATEAPQAYDVLVADAFSSDSVPVHLLTREAFALYLRHLAPDGLLVMHVSNRHLDLVPVVRGAVAALGKHMVIVADRADPSRGFTESTCVVVANRADRLPPERLKAPLSAAARRRSVLWTDDYTNLLGVLRRG